MFKARVSAALRHASPLLNLHVNYNSFTCALSASNKSFTGSLKPHCGMTEPRMRVRKGGSQFSPAEIEALITAFGDPNTPALPQTILTLDRIVTDFIIETCWAAAMCASYSRRAKIKVEDFKFMLRRDPRKLGRVTQLLLMDKKLRQGRQGFSVEEAEEMKRAKAEARAEERRAKRARGDDDDDGEGDTVVDASTVVGAGGEPPKKKRGRKKKQRPE